MADYDLRQGIEALQASLENFISRILALPEDAFLRRATDWSPRDVTAHLIGWNVYTLEGCRELRQGIAPDYLSDIPSDFAHVNAESLRRYSATNRTALIDQLRTTADALLRDLEALAPDDWTRDFGAREPDGTSSTISNQIGALTADYIGHGEEVTSWARGGETSG